MERKDIKSILQCPYKDILDYLLSIVNLNKKELEAIEEIDIKGYTEEYTAEVLGVSQRYIQQQRSKAYKKLSKAWSNSHFAYLILKELREDK